MGGRYDAAYATTPTALPAASNTRLRSRSCSRVPESSHKPATAPAYRNPAHGNIVNVDRPGSGRRYASTAGGRTLRIEVSRMIGVSIAVSTVADANVTARPRQLRPIHHR